MIFLIQRGNLLESVRPELVLTDWERHVEGEHEVLCVRTIQNVGRGSAMHVHINLDGSVIPPTAVLGTISRPILAPGGESQIDAQISLRWKNVTACEEGKSIPINLVIFCWDSRGRRYETRYILLVVELRKNVLVADPIAPGVMLHSRVVTHRSVRFLQLSRQVKQY